MGTTTTNLGLFKPDDDAAGGGDDLVDVTLDIANAMQKLDDVLGDLDSDPSSAHVRLNSLETLIAAHTLDLAKFQRVSKSASQSYVSDTTLNDDTHLTLPVAANKRYKFHMHLYVQSPVAAGFKWDITGPASFTLRGMVVASASADVTVGETLFPIVHTSSGGSGGNADAIDVIAFIITAGTAGSLLLRHAQNTSDAGTTLVQVGSWIALEDAT